MQTLSTRIAQFLALTTLPTYAYVLDLTTAQNQATLNNPILKTARHTWIMQKNNPKIARSYLLPQLSIQSTDSKIREKYPEATTDGNNFSTHYTQEQKSLAFSQTLFDMNRYYKLVQSKQQATQDLLIYQQTLQETLLYTTQHYFELILAIENVEFLTAEVEETRRRQKDIHTLFTHGNATQTQTLEVSAQLQRIQADIIQAKQVVENQKDLLANTIGCSNFTAIKALEKHSPIPPLHPPSLKHWLRDTEENNIALKIARNSIQQAKSQHKASLSNTLPTVTINGNYNHYQYPEQSTQDNAEINSFTKLNSKTYNSALSVQFALLNGGKHYYQIQKQKQNVLVAQSNILATEQTIKNKVKQLYRKLKHGYTHIHAQKLALNSSQEILRMSQISLKAGAVTVLETLTNIAHVTRDKQNLEKSKYNFLLNLTQLLTVAGKTSPENIVDINQQLTRTLPIPAEQ